MYQLNRLLREMPKITQTLILFMLGTHQNSKVHCVCISL